MKTIKECNKKIKELQDIETPKEFKTTTYKGKEIRIYKWENKPYKDFPMPKGFDWCEYNDFTDLIYSEEIKLKVYPVVYITKAQFKSNVKKGYCLSRFFSFGLYLHLDSRGESLAGSNSTGRVVISRRIK